MKFNTEKLTITCDKPSRLKVSNAKKATNKQQIFHEFWWKFNKLTFSTFLLTTYKFDKKSIEILDIASPIINSFIPLIDKLISTPIVIKWWRSVILKYSWLFWFSVCNFWNALLLEKFSSKHNKIADVL